MLNNLKDLKEKINVDQIKEKININQIKEKFKNNKLTENLDVESLEKLIPLQIAPKPPEEKTWQEQAGEEVCALFPSLSWKDRLVGCLSCMAMGYILSFGSFFRFKDLLLGDPVPFVSIATLGNIISLSGSCFLKGPTNQLKLMCKETRRIATLAYVSSLLVTLGVAFGPYWGGKAMATVLLMIVQYMAVGWYCASYIPFARQGFKKCCKKLWSEILES